MTNLWFHCFSRHFVTGVLSNLFHMLHVCVCFVLCLILYWGVSSNISYVDCVDCTNFMISSWILLGRILCSFCPLEYSAHNFFLDFKMNFLSFCRFLLIFVLWFFFWHQCFVNGFCAYIIIKFLVRRHRPIFRLIFYNLSVCISCPSFYFVCLSCVVIILFCFVYSLFMCILLYLFILMWWKK